jgi:predicted acylesterase/phospholipase RssA
LTSKDPELGVDVRHDRALKILDDHFNLDRARLDGDAETLGIAGGILKRRWADLGQVTDLTRSCEMYTRGAKGPVGDDGYAHINAAFVEDLLAALGDDSKARRARADALRLRLLAELPDPGNEWTLSTRAEALVGLGRYQEATEAVRKIGPRSSWKLETTARQLATLVYLRGESPMEDGDIRAFFETLLPGAGEAVRSVFTGKVGLALSGGGFRASYYHLGVLARLAELDVLRHVEVLSCVSGGSIVGACYWLTLRKRMLEPKAMDRHAYVQLVRDLITHFNEAVGTDLRATVQPNLRSVIRRFTKGEKGVLDPEATAEVLEERFYRPLMEGEGPIYMHDLVFTPADHDPRLTGDPVFHPGRHNWLRKHKVPVLVLNATSVNTGHAWQFTPTWMGESPWAIHEAADSVPRLEWAWYEPAAEWRVRVGQAVAASASVPGLFAPLRLGNHYVDGTDVRLVDGGAYDNQGSVSLLALGCNVLIVSDASGQFLLEQSPEDGVGGLLPYAMRSMDSLMARVRLANFADLSARKKAGLLRGLMFLHMKEGLDADPIRLKFSQKSYQLERTALSSSGVRKDFQQALAELRTDLDVFSPLEATGLMACGYKMCTTKAHADLAGLPGLQSESQAEQWPFTDMLSQITSIDADTPGRRDLLADLRTGSKRELRLTV